MLALAHCVVQNAGVVRLLSVSVFSQIVGCEGTTNTNIVDVRQASGSVQSLSQLEQQTVRRDDYHMHAKPCNAPVLPRIECNMGEMLVCYLPLMHSCC